MYETKKKERKKRNLLRRLGFEFLPFDGSANRCNIIDQVNELSAS